MTSDAQTTITIVYRGITTEEAVALGEHPKARASSWSDLMEERDRIERNRDMWKGQCARQAAELEAARADAARDEGLWAVNVQGPDDLYACASRLAALELANQWNLGFIAQQEKDHHPYDPIMRAVAIQWEHGPDAHAAALKEQGK